MAAKLGMVRHVCMHSRWRASQLPCFVGQSLQLCRRAVFALLLLPPAVRVARAARLQSALEDRLAAIVQAVNAKREHIPPVVSAAVVTFPFDISIAG